MFLNGLKILQKIIVSLVITIKITFMTWLKICQIDKSWLKV